MLAAEKNALEVVVDLRVPGVFGQLDWTTGGRTAHIVHQDINAAVSPKTGFDHACDRGALGHVAVVRRDRAAEGSDTVERLFHRLDGYIDGKDFRAFLRKDHRGGA